MRHSVMTIAIALIATSAAAQAPTSRADNDEAATNQNEVVCVVEAETGTRLSKRRVCRTRAEWTEMRRENRTALDQSQNQRPTTGN